MSRVAFNECDDAESMRLAAAWAGRYTIARRSKKGQAFFRELESVLVAMPEKRLAGGALVKDGCACAGGELLIARAMQHGETRESAMAQLAELHRERIVEHGDDMDDVLVAFGLQQTIAWSLVVKNDGGYGERKMTEEERYEEVLAWCRSNIIPEEEITHA